ncbi:MAG: hypothetical protein RL748_918, partial [Pseudomonadota bacterium]
MLAILKFELRQKLGSMSTWVYFALFFCFTLLIMSIIGGAFPGSASDGAGKVHINAPYQISQIFSNLALYSVVILAAMMGRAIQQDTEHNIWHFFYCSPISKMQYLGGRFLAALICMLLILTSLPLGAFIGCFLPGINRDLLGPIHLSYYLWPFVTTLIPNTLIFGALFFTLGALLRRMLPVYVSSVVLLVGYLIASGLAGDLDQRTLVALLDPFGSQALGNITNYWSVSDKNSRMIPLEGLLLANRLLWAGFGLLCAALCYWRFDFSALSMGGKPDRAEPEPVIPDKISPDSVQPDFSRANLLPLFLQQCRLNLKETVKNVYFAVIALTGILLIFGLSALPKIFGTPTWPVTYTVVELVTGSFGLFMLIITTFYAGELVWRERDARIAQLLDALPTPNWMPLLSKVVALISLQGILLFITMLCGLIIQTVKGYTHYEIGQYLFTLFVLNWPEYALLAVLAIALQVIIDNKYLAYFAMIGFYGFMVTASLMGLEHPMWLYAGGVSIRYSDMSGYGTRLIEALWYNLFWSGLALMLLVASIVLWVRGTGRNWSGRWHAARLELTPFLRRSLLAGCLIFVAVGSLLIYQTNIAQPWRNSKEQELEQVNYEKQYKKLAAKPQPTITDVKINADIYPQQLGLQIKGRYLLVNKTSQPVDEIFVSLAEGFTRHQFKFDRPHRAAIQDKIGFYSYKLNPALAPGEQLQLDFELEARDHG